MAKCPKRRRCCECREWYRPGLTTTKTQKSCSEACRLRRRRGQAAGRRERQLERHQKLDRERQRRHRRKGQAPPVTERVTPLSRAGSIPDPLPKKGYRMKKRDKTRRLSRAGLGMEMAEIKALLHQLVGQVGQGSAHVTGRVDSQNHLNASG